MNEEMKEGASLGERLRLRRESEDRDLMRLDESGLWCPPERWRGDSPGGWLRQTRVALGVSQQTLAALAKGHQAVVSRVESGEIHHWESIVRLFAALECEPVVRVRPKRPLSEIRDYLRPLRSRRLS